MRKAFLPSPPEAPAAAPQPGVLPTDDAVLARGHRDAGTYVLPAPDAGRKRRACSIVNADRKMIRYRSIRPHHGRHSGLAPRPDGTRGPLHRQPGEAPPQVYPGARRGGLQRPCAVDADRCRGLGTPRRRSCDRGHRRLIAAAKNDPEHGVYYVFPFLAGTRPSEQLACYAGSFGTRSTSSNLIRIRRIQERDGSLTEMTKTEAGTREMPMGATLREILLAWRVRCPRQGRTAPRLPWSRPAPAWPKPRASAAVGRCSTRTSASATGSRYLKARPAVCDAALGAAYLHLDAAGGGHRGRLGGEARRPRQSVVTLGHYTQAVRGGEGAVAALEAAYQAVP